MPKKLSEEEIAEDAEMMEKAHLYAKKVAEKLFGPNPSPDVINGVYDCVVEVDDELEIDMEETEEKVGHLEDAKAWAKKVYGNDSPEWTFEAYQRAFDQR